MKTIKKMMLTGLLAVVAAQEIGAFSLTNVFAVAAKPFCDNFDKIGSRAIQLLSNVADYLLIPSSGSTDKTKNSVEELNAESVEESVEKQQLPLKKNS